ncbi:MAG: DNA polymerase III subunit delta [Coriobacteriales bacterium]|jgi:DNA polymerase-3 subunit delta|nr:DNA polymerase III subunit delta [Coriobacteriales bacterium]
MTATEKPLSELYLFDGEDVLKQKTLLDRLRQRVEALGDLTMNYQVLTPKDISSKEYLLNALNTMPFGSPLRLVVIKDADALSKPLQEALTAYAQRPSNTTVLVLISKKLPKTSRLYKAILGYSPQSVIDCGSKKRSELPALVRSMARGEGAEITLATANLLIDRVGTSTVALNTEIRKLSAMAKATGTNKIVDEDVLRNVVRMVEPKPWDLTNALALRDTALCLRLVGRMRGYTAVGLFAQCVTRLREILTAMTLKRRGMPIAASMGKQEWQIKEILRATELYRADKIESLLVQAPQIETQMKSGADADQLLRLWIINACT